MQTTQAPVRFHLRPATPADVPAMQRIEIDAGKRYGANPATRYCLDIPARDAATHARARESGLALVAEVDAAPVGFVIVVMLDGRAHIHELAVARAHQHGGIGRALIAAVEGWAAANGIAETTLTTFREVAWNAPFYARLGYDAFEVGAERPALSAVCAEEHAAGYDATPRVVMRKLLPAAPALAAPLIVRQERPEDFAAIHDLVREAFVGVPDAEGDEQDFIARQRASDGYCPELALVVEDGGVLLAHIMLTRTAITTPAGPHPLLLLACVAVARPFQGRGIGTALVAAALARATAGGHGAVILVGDPDFYARAGFVTAAQCGIANENGFAARNVLVRELVPGTLPAGTIRFAS